MKKALITGITGEEGNDWIVFTSDKQKITDKPHPLKNPFFQQQLVA